MEFAWDGTLELEMFLIVAAVTVGAIYLKTRLELALSMPAAPAPLLGLADDGPMLAERRAPAPPISQIRLPRKLPPPGDGNNDEADLLPVSINEITESGSYEEAASTCKTYINRLFLSCPAS
jgi:hypothetical protein